MGGASWDRDTVRRVWRGARGRSTYGRARGVRARYTSAMNKGIVALIVLVVVVGGLFLWGVSVNNSLVTTEHAVNAARAQAPTVYQRRADLIPNLVETVKGFAKQEREVLEAVVKARASATQTTLSPEMLNDPQAVKKFQEAQNAL